MNLGNQVKQVMMCIEQKVYFDKKINFSRNLLQVSGFLLTFAIAKQLRAVSSVGGERRPSNDSGHFLCSYFRGLQETSLHQ